MSAADLAIMRRIDELHLEFPFAGSRMLRDMLRQEGTKIGRMHVATLMKRMAIESIYRRPNTSKPAPGHKIHRYLLRKLAIVRPNQVWATDISYIPMAKGFVYLVAIVDWFSRKVLAQEADLGECRSRWRPIFVSRFPRKRWRGSASRRFSTPMRAGSALGHAPGMAVACASLPRPSTVCCCAKRSLVAWMAGARGAKTSLLNACGEMAA